MTRTRHSGRSPMSMVSFLSWECSDQGDSDMKSLGIVPPASQRLGLQTTPLMPGLRPGIHVFLQGSTRMADSISQSGTEDAAPLAFCPFWPQIGTGRLAVDEPLANRVRSGRKQP